MLRKILEGDRCLTPKHLIRLSEIFASVIIGDGLRLKVSYPPRHGKSDLISVWGIVWYLMMRPRHRVILSASTTTLATNWCRQVRDIVNRYSDFLGFRVSDTASAGDDWMTSEGGGVRAVGVGAQVIGYGGNLIIADDIVSSMSDANNNTVMDGVWGWWRGEIRSRLQPGGSIFMVAARWSDNDLMGRLDAFDGELERKGKKPVWTNYVFPAVAYGLGVDEKGVPKRDMLGRKDGDPLWPEFINTKFLEAIQQDVGEEIWQAQYQQRTVPPDGNFFKREWIRTYQLKNAVADDPFSGEVLIQNVDQSFQSFPVSEMTAFIAADTAMTVKKENDATAIGVFLITPNRRLILKELFHGRLQAAGVEKQLLKMYREHRCAFMAIEDKANGIIALQHFMDVGITAKKMSATGDKMERAATLHVMMEQGRVFFPQDMPPHQYNAVLKEFLKFPKVSHDDIVDMMAHAARVLSEYTYDTDGEPVVIDMDFDPSHMEMA
jgi:predicted phage terminase large subunit-like protein